MLPTPLEEKSYEAKKGGKKTTHFNGCEQNVEFILRTIISANQISINGAVADMCREVSKDTMTSDKPEQATADPRTDEQRRGNLVLEYEQQFEQQSDDQKLSKLCSNAGF